MNNVKAYKQSGGMYFPIGMMYEESGKQNKTTHAEVSEDNSTVTSADNSTVTSADTSEDTSADTSTVTSADTSAVTSAVTSTDADANNTGKVQQQNDSAKNLNDFKKISLMSAAAGLGSAGLYYAYKKYNERAKQSKKRSRRSDKSNSSDKSAKRSAKTLGKEAQRNQAQR